MYIASLMSLPLVKGHRDPFDHLLLARAAAERASFVTAYAGLGGFGVAILPAG